MEKTLWNISFVLFIVDVDCFLVDVLFIVALGWRLLQVSQFFIILSENPLGAGVRP